MSERESLDTNVLIQPWLAIRRVTSALSQTSQPFNHRRDCCLVALVRTGGQNTPLD